MEWALEHQAPVSASGKVGKLKDGGIKEVVPLILGDDGRPIPDPESEELES